MNITVNSFKAKAFGIEFNFIGLFIAFYAFIGCMVLGTMFWLDEMTWWQIAAWAATGILWYGAAPGICKKLENEIS